MNELCLILALLSLGAGILSSIMVTSYVSKRGVKIDYLLWRIMIFKYFNDYEKITRQETGKVGPWHRIFVVAMILALAFVIAGLVSR